jgi:hypothetical protein
LWRKNGAKPNNMGGRMTATLTTLIGLNFTDGVIPQGSLLFDSDGDLFGATQSGGEGSVPEGAVFEIAKTAGGYASSPTPLINFDAEEEDGGNPTGGLIADANGDPFGTAGDLFEIVKPAGGYASTAATLAFLNSGAGPAGNLIADAHGDLLGSGGG